MPRKLKLDPVDVELSPEEFTRRLKAVGRGDYYFDWLKAAFEEEDNPLFAWAAFHTAREKKLPIPEWVLRYLDGTAKRLFNKPKKKEVPVHVSHALRIRTYGKGSSFSRFFDVLNRLRVVEAVMARIKGNPKNPPTLQRACCDVAEEMEKQGEKISNVTIEKWFRQYYQRPQNFRPVHPSQKISPS